MIDGIHNQVFGNMTRNKKRNSTKNTYQRWASKGRKEYSKTNQNELLKQAKNDSFKKDKLKSDSLKKKQKKENKAEDKCYTTDNST